jgi:hypothetical protein
MAVLPSGHPAISYGVRDSGRILKYTWFDGSTWHTSTVDSIDATYRSSLAIRPSRYHDLRRWVWNP